MWIVGVTVAMFAAVAAYPVFDFQVLPSSVMSISCIFNTSSVLNTKFLRGTKTQFNSVVELVQNTCGVNTAFNASDVQCECSEYRVTCNISNFEMSEDIAKWMCDIVINNIRVTSKIVTVTVHGGAVAQEQSPSEQTTRLSTSERIKTSAVYTKEQALPIRTPTDVHSTETTNLTTYYDMNTQTFETTDNGVNVNVIVFSTAGPFILFDIVLVVYLHRKKHRFCPKRSPAVAGRSVCIESGGGPVGFTYPINCVALSGEVNNTKTAHNSRTPSGHKKRMQGQFHYDDDSVYSFAKDTEVRLPDDAAFGFRKHNQELSSDARGDAVNPTVRFTSLLYANGSNEEQFCNKHSSNEIHYSTVKDDDSHNVLGDLDDPLYSYVCKEDQLSSAVKKKIKTYDRFNLVVHSPVKKLECSVTDYTHPSNNLDENGLSQYPTVGIEDEENVLYSTVQMDGTFHKRFAYTKDDTFVADGYVCDSVKRNEPQDSCAKNDSPIYSIANN
ncbi:uncharacterized protein LOC127867726 isoform X2 [Dreissena polymorpha]|uniref:uncharacterized protein LOC127867726 isoform X2 n=1 Tax=Dreissena polymorpha TaxID=45954 RepID=UPI002264A9B3|nr:uncharacterized protein LOC127867726 isoform X2 [Dreissena polymorpha]